MTSTKTQVWTDPGGNRFVVMPEAAYARLTELAEDRGLARILKKAKHDDNGGPGIPFAQIRKELAAKRLKKTSRRA